MATTPKKPFATPTPKHMGDGKGVRHEKPTMTTPGKRKDKRGGKDSTDRWTSNGYGLKSEPVSAERKVRIEKINKELAAGKKKSTAKKG